MTTIPTITALPSPPPQTSDPTDFDTRADALLTALPTMVTQENAAIAAMNTVAGEVATNAGNAAASATAASAAASTAAAAAGFADTSATSVSLTAGAKAITLDNTGNLFANGQRVALVRLSDKTAWGSGLVSSANMAAKTMTVTLDTFGPTTGGPYTDWLAILDDVRPVAPATAAELLAGVADHSAITPAGEYGALAEVALTDAATIAVDLSTFINARVTLGGSRTLGNPSNPKVGQAGYIAIVQDATGSRTLAFASNWKRAGGAPTLSTAAGAIDFIEYRAITASYIRYSFAKAPS